MPNLIHILPTIILFIHVKFREHETGDAISTYVSVILQRYDFCEAAGQLWQLRECSSSITEM
jgi:hypothetical protein